MSVENFSFKGRSFTALLNLAILVIVPAFILGAGIYGAYLHGWKMLLAALPFALLLGGLAFFMVSERARWRRATVSIDTDEGLVEFRDFRFTAAFLPEKPRKVERIRFEEIIAAYPCEFSKGTMGVEVRTTKGKVCIPDEMDRFPVLASLLGEIASANAADKAGHQKAVDSEPAIRTAWYGWVILAASVGVVLHFGWRFMYAE